MENSVQIVKSVKFRLIVHHFVSFVIFGAEITKYGFPDGQHVIMLRCRGTEKNGLDVDVFSRKCFHFGDSVLVAMV